MGIGFKIYKAIDVYIQKTENEKGYKRVFLRKGLRLL